MEEKSYEKLYESDWRAAYSYDVKDDTEKDPPDLLSLLFTCELMAMIRDSSIPSISDCLTHRNDAIVYTYSLYPLLHQLRCDGLPWDSHFLDLILLL